jgi:Tfp pilus assembly protein PilW
MEVLMKRFLPRPTYANVVSTLCLFLLLGGGSALAATQLAKNSVGAKQIKKNAVATAKIKNAAVTNSKLAADAVTSGNITAAAVTTSQLAANAVTDSQLAANAVTSGKIADAAVTGSKLAANAVTSGNIADNAVTNTKLAANAVTSGKIADGEVRAPDLGTILTVQESLQIAAGAEGTVDVACPAGSVMLSGGGFWTVGANNLRTTVKQGNGWRVEGKNTLGVSAPLTVQAYCLTG